MKDWCNCLKISRKKEDFKYTLPSSWNWEDEDCDYENIDCQPDKNWCEEKQTILKSKLKNLLIVNEYSKMTRLEYIIDKIRKNNLFPSKSYYFSY